MQGAVESGMVGDIRLTAASDEEVNRLNGWEGDAEWSFDFFDGGIPTIKT